MWAGVCALVLALIVSFSEAAIAWAEQPPSGGPLARDLVQVSVSPPGSTIVAGPVLSEAGAIWPEASADTLSLRALNGAGRLETVWSQSSAPGVHPGLLPELTVPSISAGAGRIAFVRSAWAPSGGDLFVPPLSSTLFAGRPGRIRALRSINKLCDPHPGPVAVAVSNAGLVSYEESQLCSPRPPKAVLLLRSFAGHRLRRLHSFQSTGEVSSLSAAGHWAAWLEYIGKKRSLRVVDLRSGSSVLTQTVPQTARTVAIDAQGNFAIATRGFFDGCPPDRRLLAEIRMASISHPRPRTIFRGAANADLALFRGTVAFAAAPGGCALTIKPALSRDQPPVRFPAFPGLSGLNGIAYDGRALAIGDGHRVLLATVGALK